MNSYDYILTSNGELYHYGIKGQKWGVRRYQNKDGSLTLAGKRKYSKEFRKTIENGSKAGKSWYDISEDLSKDDRFKSVIKNMQELRDAHKTFNELARQREDMYAKQTKKISRKELNRLIDDDIEKNRDFYKEWKARFFDKDGKATSELRSYVEDAIQSERASKDMSFNDIDKAYNQAWKKYDQLRSKAVNDLVGRYAHEYVSTKAMNGSRSTAVRQIVEIAIANADLQIERE